MKLTVKEISLYLGILVSIIILPDINMYYHKYKLRSEKLPDIYKNKVELYNLKDDYYEIIDLGNITSESILQINDSTIIIYNSTNKDSKEGGWDSENVWYKINLKGQIIDSLKYNYNSLQDEHFYKTFNNYIVDIKQKTFCNWITNSDITHYPIKNLDEDKIFSKKEAEEITNNGIMIDTEYIYLGENGANSKNKILLFKNDSWNYFFAEKKWYKSANYITNKFQAEFYYLLYEEPEVASTSENGEKNKQIFINVNNSKSIIHREYVHKDEWNESSFWSKLRHISWGSGNGSRIDGWLGTSYFALKMPKKKLYYKQNVYIDYPEENLRDVVSYSVYRPKNGEYVILDSYLIRPKKNFR